MSSPAPKGFETFSCRLFLSGLSRDPDKFGALKTGCNSSQQNDQPVMSLAVTAEEERSLTVIMPLKGNS